MEGRFVIRLGARSIVLPPGRTTIGRSPDRELQLDDDRVSRRHAVLRTSETEVDIEDLGSVNGVFVDGARIAARTPLCDGSVIEIGDARLVLRDRGLGLMTPDSGMTRVPAGPSRDARPGVTAVGVNLGFLTLHTIRALADADLGRLEAPAKVLLDHLSTGRCTGDPALSEALEAATRSALLLARATRDASWLDRAFEANGACLRLLDLESLQRIDEISRDLGPHDPTALTTYLDKLRERSFELDPEALVRFVRVEELERGLTTRRR